MPVQNQSGKSSGEVGHWSLNVYLWLSEIELVGITAS